jgi:hypothetical protein
MDLIQLLRLCPDIKTYVYSYLPDGAKYFCNFVCKDLMIHIQPNRKFKMSDYIASFNNQNLINFWMKYRHNNDHNIMVYAICKFGNIETLTWFNEKYTISNMQEIGITAAKYGHCHIIKWISESYIIDIYRCIYAAVWYNQINVVNLLKNYISITNTELINIVCYKTRNVEMLECLHNIGLKYKSHHIENAAQNGYLSILKYIHLSEPIGTDIWFKFNSWILVSMEICEWALSLDYDINDDSIECAILHRTNCLIEYHIKYGFTNKQILYIAKLTIINEKIDLLKWLYSINPNILQPSFYKCQNKEIITWLFEVKCPFDIYAFNNLLSLNIYDIALEMANMGCPTSMKYYSEVRQNHPELAKIMLKNEIIDNFKDKPDEFADFISQLKFNI